MGERWPLEEPGSTPGEHAPLRRQEKIPFAVVGADQEHQVNGKRVLGRKTKWGIIEGERSPLHPQPSPGLVGGGGAPGVWEAAPMGTSLPERVLGSADGGMELCRCSGGTRSLPGCASQASLRHPALLPAPCQPCCPLCLALQWRIRHTASSPSCGTC